MVSREEGSMKEFSYLIYIEILRYYLILDIFRDNRYCGFIYIFYFIVTIVTIMSITLTRVPPACYSRH